MSPKLKSVLARVTLAGGVALVASLVARTAPHEQIIRVRLGLETRVTSKASSRA